MRRLLLTLSHRARSPLSLTVPTVPVSRVLSITRLELTNAFKAAGLQYDDKVIADTFDKADQNKDGSVDFGEFVALADALANRS